MIKVVFEFKQLLFIKDELHGPIRRTGKVLKDLDTIYREVSLSNE